MDPAVARLLEPRPGDVRPPPSLLRDPARVLVVIGAVLAIAASPLPWLVKVGRPPPRTMTGWSGLFDGFLISVVAAALVWLVLNRDLAGASTRLLRWLPSILGGVAVALGVSALRNMENQIGIWSSEGATGDYQPWLFVCLGGVAISAAGTFVLGVRLLREPGTVGRGPAAIGLSTATKVTLVGGSVGGVLGIAGGVVLVLRLDIDPMAISLPLMLATVLGGIVGANVGVRVARAYWAADPPGR